MEFMENGALHCIICMGIMESYSWMREPGELSNGGRSAMFPYQGIKKSLLIAGNVL